MLIILPIAVGGGFGYSSEGYLDYLLLVQVLIGTMLGVYIGAKFTNYTSYYIKIFDDDDANFSWMYAINGIR